MKILIIRFSSLGDVILTTPVFNYLKKVDPESEITFLTDKYYVEMFADDPRLESVIGFKKHESIPNLSIFNMEWDHVIDLQNSKRSRLIISHLKKYKKLSTFHKLHFPRTMLLLTRTDLYPTQSDVISRYLCTAGMNPENKDINKAPDLYFNKAADSTYHKLLQSDLIIRPSIAFFPFSAWKNKEWPIRYYSIAGKYFLTKGWNVILMGSADEQEQAEHLRSLISTKVISLAGKHTLYECGCILKNCQLALGNDSGLSHLARACGVKTGIIYGPTTNHLGFFPSGVPQYRIFEQEMFCRPCHPHGGNFCIKFNNNCMRQIYPEKVINGMLSLFHSP